MIQTILIKILSEYYKTRIKKRKIRQESKKVGKITHAEREVGKKHLTTAKLVNSCVCVKECGKVWGAHIDSYNEKFEDHFQWRSQGGGGALGHWPPFLMKLNLKCNYNILKKYCKLCFKSSLIFTTFLFTTNFCADLNFDITSPQKALVIASYQCGGIKYLRVSIRVWSRDGEPFQVVGQI